MTTINFERDAIWSPGQPAELPTFGVTGNAFNDAVWEVMTDGLLWTRAGYAQCRDATFPGTNDFHSMGVNLRPPPEINTMYRVKGSATSSSCWFGFILTDDAGNLKTGAPSFLVRGQLIDESVCVRFDPLAPTAAITFFVAMPNNATSPIASLSVQRLVSKPEEFMCSVS